MTLAAAMNEKEKLSKEEVKEMMNTVLCRCGTYTRIDKAIDKLVGEGE